MYRTIKAWHRQRNTDLYDGEDTCLYSPDDALIMRKKYIYRFSYCLFCET